MGQRSLIRALREERGMALVLAIGMMMVLTATSTTAIYYATSNSHTTGQSSARASAYDLAEAGINSALAKLYHQLDGEGAVIPGGTDPRSPTFFTPATTIQYPSLNGSVTYTGTIDSNYIWTITSTGSVTTSGQTLSRTLTRKVTVRGINDGASATAWSRFYSDDPNWCLNIDTVAIPAAVATRGGLCLENGGTITGAATTVDVGGNITIDGPDVSSPAQIPSAASGWNNPANVYTSNNGYATTASLSGSTTGVALTATGFGFSLPARAIVRGVTVTIERKTSVSSTIRDFNVSLVKAGAATGNNKAATSTSWPTSDGTATYGSASDVWGATLSAADVGSSGFGVQVIPRNYGSSAAVGSIDAITITVRYTSDTNGIGTSAVPVHEVNVNGSCRYNAVTASPCTTDQNVYAASNTAQGKGLEMPDVDFTYWWQNAKPGPKHFCTNSSPGITTSFFDNDAGTTNAPNHSLSGNGEVTPSSTSYTCKVIENGVTTGELSWNAGTHVLTIYGTVFVDGDFRFDDDGQVVHYQGRGIIYTSGDVEFDEIVCAGGTGTTAATSCLSNMSSWAPSQNFLVLLSQGDSEYDQGGSSCSGSPSVSCPNGRWAAGFQGVVYATGTCTIHESFKLSGPVVCNRLSLPYESDGWPTYYPYPSLSDLVDGQKYSNTATATNFELISGAQSG